MNNVAGFIARKSLIYKTNVEYGDYTINHVIGCAHGCLYPCYAYMMAKRFGKVKGYEEWLKPYIVENALELLNLELPKYKDKIKILHLCFTTDPFMYGYPEISKLSLDIIKKCNENGIICSTLTKGILPIELASFSPQNEYGITLVSINEEFRESMEPFTAPYKIRIEGLKKLHDLGFKTWVSIEPYPTPNIFEQDILEILNCISFVDKIVFGRLNYNSYVSKYKKYKEFYNELSNKVISFCENKGIQYHIKNGTMS